MPTVAAAIIINDHKIFITQRPEGKSLAHHWEFPGGKQEQGETLPQTLKRELNEELNINAKIGDFFMSSSYQYEFGQIDMHCFFVSVDSPQISSNEHEATAWVSAQELKNYTFAPADIPIVEALCKLDI